MAIYNRGKTFDMQYAGCMSMHAYVPTANVPTAYTLSNIHYAACFMTMCTIYAQLNLPVVYTYSHAAHTMHPIYTMNCNQYLCVSTYIPNLSLPIYDYVRI